MDYYIAYQWSSRGGESGFGSQVRTFAEDVLIDAKFMREVTSSTEDLLDATPDCGTGNRVVILNVMRLESPKSYD